MDINAIRQKIFKMTNCTFEGVIESEFFEGVKVCYNGTNATIGYSTKPQFARACTLLAKAISEGKTSLDIIETPNFKSVGVMLDMSRNGVMRAEKVKEYMDSNVAFAKENGYVKTLLGRKRYIREINSANYNLRSFGERAAMNMPLQGTAADVIKIAMIKVANKIKEKGLKSKLILQVHDELIVDTHPDEIEAIKELLQNEMQSAVKLSVPLDSEAKVGERWFDAK